MPAILPCPCTGRKNTKRLLSQVMGQVVSQVTGQVVLQVTGQVVLQTNLTQFSHSPVEVHRSQGDIQWLYEVLLDTAPQEGGASSQASHLIGRHCNKKRHHIFVVFLSGTDYLVSLEHHLLGLALHMEQSTRLKSSTEKTVHWFCALSESEPANTYLKVAMGNLAQTYESVEGHQIDTDDTLFIQSLQIM
ncbi:hypothetical protein EMCRGX_G000949 [Ephydatia muelleri]